jgi:uncharacterized GH25 family protein
MRTPFKYFIFAAIILFAQHVAAHGQLIVPSHTIVSGDKPEAVTLSYSVTNDVFHADRAFAGVSLDTLVALQAGEISVEQAFKPEGRFGSINLEVVAPNGDIITRPFVNFGRASVSSALLDKNGTYIIGVAGPARKMTTYKDVAGKTRRHRGPLSTAKLPDGATDVREITGLTTVQTYVTRNDISQKTLQPKNKGLEIVWGTHPNELFVGESTQLTVLLDGKKVKKGTELKLTRGGTRWRNDRDIRTFATDKKGRITVDWDHAGLWLLEMSVESKGKNKRNITRHQAYITLEVNPE